MTARAAAALLLALPLAGAAPARAGGGEVAAVVTAVDGPGAGAPIPGARVAAARAAGDGPFDPDALLGGGGVAAGEDGRALLPLPPGEGRVLVAAVAPGRAPALAWAPADGRPAALALFGAGPLDVVVLKAPPEDATDAADRPLPGAVVTLVPGRGFEPPGVPRLLRRVRAGPDGTARLLDLARGPFWDAEARAPGFAPGRAGFLLAGGAPARIALAAAGRLVGRVVRVPGGDPVAGARVTGGGAEAVTDGEGWYALADLPEGVVEVRAEARGTLALDVPSARSVPGKTTPVPDLRLANLARVRLVLQDREGRPLAGVPVRLLPARGAAAPPGPPPAALSEGSGRALLEGVVPGAGHRIVVDPASRFAPRVTDAFAVLPGEMADLGAIRLDTGGVLSGEVAGPDGKPVEGASLVLFDGETDPLRAAADTGAGGPLRRELPLPPDGRFRLDLVPAGPRSLLARAPGRLPAALTRIDVAAGREERGLRLVLRPGAAIAGVVLDPEGKPVPDALLVALAPPLATEAGRARSGPGGRFRIEGLAPGAYALRLLLPEEPFPDPLRPTFPATAPSEDEVLRIPGRRPVEGTVADPAGGPVRGQVVVSRLEAGDPGGRLLEVAREVERIPLGEDGAFRTRPLPDGRWRLRAESPDGRVASADVDLSGGAEEPVLLRLSAGTSVRGRVVTGALAKDPRLAVIRLLLGGRSEASVPPAAVEANGAFALHGVPPGEHDLVVSLPGLAPVVLRGLLVPPEGGVVDVGEVLLGRGANLRVRLLGEGRGPVHDAEVAVVDEAGLRREERTNPSGLALFAGLAGGLHGIEVRVPSGALLRRPVRVPPEGELEEVVDLGVDPPGTATVRREGGPVPGAAVRILDEARGPAGYEASVEVVADERGVARIPCLPEGALLVEVTPPGEPPVRLSLASREGRLEIDLPADGISGEVRTARDGEPLPGAEVRAWSMAGADAGPGDLLRPSGAGTTADARGRFRFPSLPPGLYLLEASARGHGTARVAGVAVLRGAGAAPVRILLERAGRVRGVVRDPAGGPVPGAVVEATDAATGEILPGGRRTADAAGRYSLDGLAPGTFVLTARAGGLGASPPEVLALAPGEERTADLDLVPGGTLEVRVVGAGGRPVADASVEVRDFFGRPVPPPGDPGAAANPLLGAGRTDGNGVLRVPGLRAGVYVVTAWKDGLAGESRARVDARGGARTVVAILNPTQIGDGGGK